MSSDTAKENASVVDSSVTGWRQDMGNSEDPESSSYKANEDGDPSREDFHDFRGNSAANKKGKLCDTRYFIIKSLNHHNIQLSIEKGIWATQVMNEPILEEAFHELSPDIGEALCGLLDGKGDFDGLQNRDDFPSKRPCLEPSCSLGDEEYDMPSWHMSWSQAPMLYSSLMYQHQAGASRYQLAHQRTGDRDVSSQFDAWGLSGESPLASVLTEDEFLEMSYEEYLEAHSRSNKQLCFPASGRSFTTHDSSKSKKQDNADTSKKRTYCSSQK